MSYGLCLGLQRALQLSSATSHWLIAISRDQSARSKSETRYASESRYEGPPDRLRFYPLVLFERRQVSKIDIVR